MAPLPQIAYLSRERTSGPMSETTILDLDAVRAAPVKSEPFSYFMGSGVLKPGAAEAVQRSFPDIHTTGFHPLEEMKVEGAFKTLIDEVTGDALGRVLQEKFGVDFNALPKLVTVRKLSAAHEGRIHTDGEKKVMTMLFYLNDTWDSPDGRFRVLRSDKSFDDYVEEASPETGAFAAFMRADNSWHGHTPFVGERRVVQIAWLRDQAALESKQKTHRLTGALKKVFARR